MSVGLLLGGSQQEAALCFGVGGVGGASSAPTSFQSESCSTGRVTPVICLVLSLCFAPCLPFAT